MAKSLKPRNPLVVALYRRHGTTTKVMRDRRAVRGGARRQDWRKEWE